MEKFKSKYRIESARLKNWDYGSNGMYFITICTRNREHFFGEINNDEMFLNRIGKIANNCWIEIPEHFEHIELGEFTIMPNHVHGIIIINKPMAGDVVNTGPVVVETGHALSLQQQQIGESKQQQHPRFRNQGKNTISAMVGSFKSAVTRLSGEQDFGWQSRFHDHIIRNEDEFIRISQYIIDNPKNWKNDKFYNGK
jgi:REP element-mobilizing transposase RayT